jgi:Sulfotransferase domain
VLVGVASQIVRVGLGTGTVKDRKAPPRGAGKLERCLVFLCAGLKSSGSTWLYNAVVQLVEDDHRRSRRKQQRTGLLRFYADGMRDFPPGAEQASALVIKTHIPSHSLEFLTRFARGSVLITVREPRDAVASLMQRFDHRFEACLKEVAANASRMVDLFQSGEALVFRYEDRFYDRPETLDEIARHLHLKTSRFALQRTFASLTAPNIEKRILSLSARGAFGETPTPDSFDPKTHWHPGHVGDRLIGKYAAVLTPKMQQAVLHAMRDYCAVFRYPIAGKSGQGRANSKRPSRGKVR